MLSWLLPSVLLQLLLCSTHAAIVLCRYCFGVICCDVLCVVSVLFCIAVLCDLDVLCGCC